MEERKVTPIVNKSAFEELEKLGCEIHWFKDGDFEIPQKLDFSSFPSERKDNATRALGVLISYIRSPAIVDQFENHTQRRRWRATLGPELSEVVRHDRLRGNNTGAVFEYIRFISEWIASEDLRVGNIRAILDQLRLNYPISSDNTPLEFADLVAGSAFDVLNMFSEDYSKEIPG